MDLVWLWYSPGTHPFQPDCMDKSFKTRPYTYVLGFKQQYLLHITVYNLIFFCRLGGRASSDHRQKDIQGEWFISFALKLFIFIAGIFWLAVAQKDSGRELILPQLFVAHYTAPSQPLIIWFCFLHFFQNLSCFLATSRWLAGVLAFVYVRSREKSLCIWEV